MLRSFSKELSKYFMLVALLLFFKSIKELQNRLIPRASQGAGLAFIENSEYGMEYVIRTTIVCSLFCPPDHKMHTAPADYFIPAAIFSKIEVRDDHSGTLALFAFVPTAVLHGLYNASFDLEYKYSNTPGNLSQGNSSTSTIELFVESLKL